MNRAVERTSAAGPTTTVLAVGARTDRFGSLFVGAAYRAIPVDDPPPPFATSDAPVPFRPTAELGAPTDHYDVVCCIETLGRALDPLGLAAELSRVLAPTGHLFLTAPLALAERPAPPPGRPRLGLNFVLQSAALDVIDLTAIVDTDDYGLVARRRP